MGKVKLLPELRFPGFEGEWEEKKLEQLILNIDSGWSPQCEEFSAQIGEWGVLKTTAVVWDGFDENENKKLPDVLKGRTEIEVVINDILVTRAGPTNRVGVAVHVNNVREKLMLSDKIIRLKILNDNNSKFVSIILGQPFAQEQLVSKSSGLATSQTNITQKILLQINIIIPQLEEQTRIATFLTSIDRRISLLTQKKEKLVCYKQGVMQKIFSQELRFKDEDGKDFPEWEEKRLGDVCNIQSGKDKLCEDGIYSLYGSMGIIGKCNNALHDGKYILVARVGANAGAINLSEGRFGVSDNALLIQIIDLLNVDFLYYLLINQNLNRLVFGSGQPLITGGQLKSLIIKLPMISEQTRIASFLTALDQQIEKVDAQIGEMKGWKKGLLQKMFV